MAQAAPPLEQLVSQLGLAGWDGELCVVEGNEHGWRHIWPSFVATYAKHKAGLPVILIIEDDESGNGMEAETRNQLREMFRNEAELCGIINYASIDEALIGALVELGLQ